MNIGYIRVSTINGNQEFYRQEYILKDYKIDRLYEEKISGTKQASHRPEFEKLLKEVNEGDVIYFESMSRMARSIQDLIETTNILANDKKCTVVFLKENLRIGGDGLDAIGQLIFHIMGAFAQFERDLIADRTKQGLNARKQMGIQLGRPKKTNEEIEKSIIKDRIRNMQIKDICLKYDISKGTVISILQKAGLSQKKIK